MNARLRPLLSAAPVDDDASDILPFHESDLTALLQSKLETGSETDSLRVVIQRLKKRYEQIVFNRYNDETSDEQNGHDRDDDGTSVEIELPAIWDREVDRERRRISQQTLLSMADHLTAGVELWLEFLLAEGLSDDGWDLTEVRIERFGEHIRYGQCVVGVWRRGADEHRHGIAFLLAGGRGMSSDLDEKLGMMRSSSRRADTLLIVWPRGQISEPVYESLPTTTAAVWASFTESREPSQVRWTAISPEQLAGWMAVSEFRRLVTDENGVENETLTHFVNEQLAPFNDYATPWRTHQ